MNEHLKVPGMRLGRRMPSNKPALHLSRVLLQHNIKHPTRCDYLKRFSLWDVLGNDEYGDCGPVAVANLRRLVTRYLGNEDYPDLADVLDLYRRSGNPGFPADDNGVDMQTMLEELHRNGINGQKCVAFAKLDVIDVDLARAAINVFGGVLLGVDLQLAQQAQTFNGGPWDFVLNDGEWGGHAVMAAAYDMSGRDAGAPDVGLVTWGEKVQLTDRFWNERVMEAWVVIWPEHLQLKGFDENVNLAQLALDYRALTGRELPLPAPTPAPVPPAVMDPDAALWEVVAEWAELHRHSGETRRVAKALREWHAAKGI